MAQPTKFKCEACERSYTWKPELSGKKVRCKCGQVMHVPQQIVEPVDPPPVDDLYELAGDREEKAARTPQIQQNGQMTCPACRSTIDAGSVLCMNCGMNFQTGKKMRTTVGGPDLPPPELARPALARPQGVAVANAAVASGSLPRTLGYASRNPQKAAKEAEDANAALKQLTWPVIMVFLGLALMLTHAMLRYEVGVPVGLVVVGVTLLVNMVFITIGCLIAIKLLDISLGSPAEAILKVCAVALLPGAISGLIEWKLGVIGGMVGWGVALAMYSALLVWFFDLDTMEVMILTTIIWLVRTWIGYIVLAVILSAILGGGAWGTGAGPMAMFGGGGTNEIVLDGSPAGRNNRYAQALIQRGDVEEGTEFAEGNEVNNVINFDNAQTRKMIADLHSAGAEEVYVSQVNRYNDRRQADKVIVELPEDPDARKRLFEAWREWFEKNKEIGAPPDLGDKQAYLVLNFDGAED